MAVNSQRYSRVRVPHSCRCTTAGVAPSASRVTAAPGHRGVESGRRSLKPRHSCRSSDRWASKVERSDSPKKGKLVRRHVCVLRRGWGLSLQWAVILKYVTQKPTRAFSLKICFTELARADGCKSLHDLLVSSLRARNFFAIKNINKPPTFLTYRARGSAP
jgi:hypothetical protein